VTRALAAAVALALAPGRGAAEAYGVRLPPGGLVVDVPYSMGTHHERATEVHGALRVDPERRTVERGRLAVPLASFRSDDAKRGCHLREALGLDYGRSRFPGEHVCDGANRLPASGADALAYPEIVLELEPGAAAAAGDGAVEVAGALTVHGVTRPVRLALRLAREASGLWRVRGSLPVRLADFGVVVKPAKVLFVSIEVREVVTVHVDAFLEPLGR
jgi:polyisoprenoid-binding protein YceI